ncbi:MAG: acyl-CoA dehydrogenase family protein [SAR324 cluster bacterium]|nr:acyl-CoA dehydrogenase family protein [SAR324 cluster bacterium]
MRPTPAERSAAGKQKTADPLELANRLAPVIEAGAAESEARRELTPAIFDALLEAGFYRLLLPRSVGGYELTPSRFSEVLERIAMADGSTAWCLGQAGGCAMAAGHLPPQIAQEIFAPRRTVLAWGAGPSGQALSVEGGYEVSGTWMFASGGRQADWLGAHVPLCEPDGTPRRAEGGKPLVRTMLFPAHEAQFSDVWHVVGLRATGSDNYSVNHLFVPGERSFVLDGEADPSQTGVLYRFPITLVYAGGFAGVALGLARGMFDALIELAKNKVPHKQTKTLRDNSFIQVQVALAEAKLGSARIYLLRTLEEVQAEVQASDGRGLSAGQRMRIRLATTYGIHQAKEAADIAYRAAGSTAIFEHDRFERRFRDLHAVTQQIQARHTQLELVGQYLLGVTTEPGNY